ncbi:MAG TPA: hypothetical protein VK834_11800 [Bradyrhizobium sp.]|jgi:hypothetical protein|nr:hypothetical protein [Bradyrhizobium sp.]
MSSAETGSQAAPPTSPAAAPRATHRLTFWLRELPFALVLILTTLGVAYTSFSKQPIVGFWELLAPLIALVCIGSGWPSAADRTARLTLIGSQALHWLAFIVVMNLLLLPSVQRNFTANSTAIAVFTLLALGTFTAGLQVFSWQVCALGLVMALSVPAIAWIENSALIVVVIFAMMLAVGVVVWWHWRKSAAADRG